MDFFVFFGYSELGAEGLGVAEFLLFQQLVLLFQGVLLVHNHIIFLAFSLSSEQLLEQGLILFEVLLHLLFELVGTLRGLSVLHNLLRDARNAEHGPAIELAGDLLPH